ncbi:MAG: DUF1269 domain-containing protein [Actinomycetota bacterium]|nr:DUF1269 domain-containing protein [Actinomycetota bacterium]
MSTKPPDDSKLLVVSFEDALRAQEFLIAVARLQHREEIQLHDAVIISRTEDGGSHVRETTDVTPGQAGVGAGVWGLLLGTLFGGPIGGLVVGAASAGGGALLAKLVDTGVKDETIEELRTTVPPGRTAVALLVSHVSVADLQTELARFPHAQLVETDLPPAAVSAVQNALEEGNRAPFTTSP